MRAAICLLALGTVTAAVAGARAAEPDEPPVRIDVREKILDNGLRVLVAPRKCGPRVACAMWFRVGSADEQPGKTGLAHVLEHLMFKGTHRIGVKDAKLGERIAAQLDACWARKRAAEQRLGDRLHPLRLEDRARADRTRKFLASLDRLVEAGTRERDFPAALTLVSTEAAALAKLLAAPEPPEAALFASLRRAEDELAHLLAEERRNDNREELWDLYVQAGGTNLNAFTTEDTTNYVVTLPSNKLELFCWLEADRLADPVFREWYPERDVVKEERRIDENAPDGAYGEALSAVAFGPHPYGHPILGWMKDLDGLTPADARAFFDRFYAPENATCVLVGDVDPEAAFALCARYLGKVPRRAKPEPWVPAEPTAPGEKRFVVDAEAEPRVEILWKAPEAGSADHDALEVIATLLSGETGRLYQSLVMEAQLAVSTEASNDVHRYPGRFHVAARVKPESDLEQVEQLLEAEVAAIGSEGGAAPLTQDELDRAKARIAAEQLRGLEDLEGICERLGQAQAVLGDWRAAVERPERASRVTLEQVRAVANRVFRKAGRTVGVLRRRPPEAPLEPPGEDADRPSVPAHPHPKPGHRVATGGRS